MSSGCHIVLVVSPLRALMMDQVRRCIESGIKAVMLAPLTEMSMDDKKGKK